MAKRSTKSDELIEALCDDKVVNALASKIQDKLTQNINAIMDAKLEEFKLDLNKTMQETLDKLTNGKLKEITSVYQRKLDNMDQRISQLETNSYQNELMIFGHKVSGTDTALEVGSNSSQSTQQTPLLTSIQNLLKSDLNIQLKATDINFAYVLKPRGEPKSSPSPILVSFTSVRIKNEILQRVKVVRKQQLKNTAQTRVYYNERLSKLNQEIYYQARLLVKDRKIGSAWIFRGEVYIKKEASSHPLKMISLEKLYDFK